MPEVLGIRALIGMLLTGASSPPETASADAMIPGLGDAGIERDLAPAGHLVQLAELFGRGHPRDQLVGPRPAGQAFADRLGGEAGLLRSGFRA